MSRKIIKIIIDLFIVIFFAILLYIIINGGFSINIFDIRIRAHSIKNPIISIIALVIIREFLASYKFINFIKSVLDRTSIKFQKILYLLDKSIERFPKFSKDNNIFIGISLISISILMLELILTRLFSVTMFYHYAFMAISIALFGISLSGIIVYIFQNRFNSERFWKDLPYFASLFSAANFISLIILLKINISLHYSFKNFLLLLSIYIISIIPFLLGGICVSIAITHLSRKVSRLYFFDLIGASLGCLIVIPLLNLVGAPSAIIFVSLFASIAAFLFNLSYRGRSQFITSSLLIIFFFTLIVINVNFQIIDVKYTKGHKEVDLLFKKWNSFSRVAIYKRKHQPWGVSPFYRGKFPETVFMDIDASASTPIINFDGNFKKLSYLRYDLTTLAYNLKNGKGFNSLIIGPGGGQDVLAALMFGAKKVYGIEINPIIVNDVMRKRYKDFSGGLYFRPDVKIIVDEGRSYLRRSKEKFDVIQATLVDTWAATSAGAYSLSENSLYTVEAFIDYINHLKDNGVLTFSRWAHEGLRLITISQDALRRLNIDKIENRIIIVLNRNLCNFLLKKNEFSVKEVKKIENICKNLGFDIVYAPYIKVDNNDFTDLILTKDRNSFFKKFKYDITPTTDNRPFFFHIKKLKDVPNSLLRKDFLFGDGLTNLISLLIISTILVILFIILPLLIFKRKDIAGERKEKLKFLIYFAFLGTGFMFLEISFMQKFILFLGHPIYSLTVILFSILFSSSIGSFFTGRFDNDNLSKNLNRILIIIIAISALYIFILPGIFYNLIYLNRFLRILISILLLFPLGFFMGMALPLGIRIMDKRFHSIVPWGWGINGATSVLGSGLSIFLAMNFGFNISILAGIISYAFAFIIPKN
jgi:hypothetical protein